MRPGDFGTLLADVEVDKDRKIVKGSMVKLEDIGVRHCVVLFMSADANIITGVTEIVNVVPVNDACLGQFLHRTLSGKTIFGLTGESVIKFSEVEDVLEFIFGYKHKQHNKEESFDEIGSGEEDFN